MCCRREDCTYAYIHISCMPNYTNVYDRICLYVQKRYVCMYQYIYICIQVYVVCMCRNLCICTQTNRYKNICIYMTAYLI